MRVCLAGPCSPADCTELMYESSVQAISSVGYRGLPVSLLAHGLVAAGHSVTVVTTAPGATGHFSGPNFDLIQVASRPRARARALDLFEEERSAIAGYLKSVEFDVVHAHWTYEFALAALSVKAPTLVTAHDSPFTVLRHLPDPYRTARLLMALSVSVRRPQMTAVSPYLVSKWRRHLLNRRDMPVISNIVRRLDPVETVRHGPDFVVGYVGTFDRRKNVRALLVAASHLRKRGLNLKLLLVGDPPPESDRLWDDIRALGLSGSTEMAGQLNQRELNIAYQSMNVLVNPSREETQSLTLLEALSVGIPCIGGSTSGAVPWTLDFGRAGQLVNVERPECIALAISTVAEHPASLSAMIEHGRQLVSSRASMTQVTTEYVAQYECL